MISLCFCGPLSHVKIFKEQWVIWEIPSAFSPPGTYPRLENLVFCLAADIKPPTYTHLIIHVSLKRGLFLQYQYHLDFRPMWFIHVPQNHYENIQNRYCTVWYEIAFYNKTFYDFAGLMLGVNPKIARNSLLVLFLNICVLFLFSFTTFLFWFTPETARTVRAQLHKATENSKNVL